MTGCSTFLATYLHNNFSDICINHGNIGVITSKWGRKEISYDDIEEFGVSE